MDGEVTIRETGEVVGVDDAAQRCADFLIIAPEAAE